MTTQSTPPRPDGLGNDGPVDLADFSWSDYEAVLFDLDGVVTPTADVHERAWKELFSESYDYLDSDYVALIDGKPRFDGVRDFLASRDVVMPEGDLTDPPDQQTISGLGNRKNAIFNRILDDEGIAPFPGTIAVLDHLDKLGVKFGLVSSSRNATKVLVAAGLEGRFPVVVDGNTTAERGLPGKPAPDGYLLGATLLGVDPARTVVVEDAVSGVAAGAAGGFAAVIGVDRGAGAEALRQSGADLVVEDLSETLSQESPSSRRRSVPQGLPQDRFPADPWRLVETRHDVSDLGTTETLFGLANGYLGLRANPEEGRDAHTHGSFLNGFHESWPIRHAEDAFGFARTGQTIVNVPDAKLIKLYVDDDPLLLSNADLESYERSLDFRDGVLRRQFVWITPSGKRVEIRTTRFVSLVHKHLAVMQYEVVLPEDTAPIVLSSQILNRQDGKDEYHVAAASLGEGRDPRKSSGFSERVLEPTVQRQGGAAGDGNTNTNDTGEVVLGYRTRNSKMTLACGVRHDVEAGEDLEVCTEVSEDRSKTVFSTTAQPGVVFRLTKYVAYHTSTGVPAEELADRCTRTLQRAAKSGHDALAAQQHEFLDDFWAKSDISTSGDARHQQAIRWNLFQLAQASARVDEQGIPAKGVSGGGYDGHYFWDTEAYLVPFLSHTNQSAARKILRFRWRTLDRARLRAVELNQVGALFPWRTINGDECSAYYAAGTAQYHINAAIAYAIERYVKASGDEDFLADEGAEMLIETARLWADLGFFGSDKRFHIHRVTGPDEYTTVVNDNVYTNVMARNHLRYAVESIRRLESSAKTELEALRQRTGLEDAEVDAWATIAESMFVPYDEELGIHPQDTNFLELEPWPWETAPPEKHPLLLHYHPLVIYRHQVLKQADVVLATVLRPNEFTPEQRRRNFDYYDPITTGDSSLSSGAQATAAVRVGREALAWDYFRSALYLDLCDTHGNTADGVHIAAAGGMWNAVSAGFLGFVDNGDSIRIDPRVPDQLGTISIRLALRDLSLRIDARRTSCVLTIENPGQIEVLDGDGRSTSVAYGEPVRLGPEVIDPA